MIIFFYVYLRKLLQNLRKIFSTRHFLCLILELAQYQKFAVNFATSFLSTPKTSISTYDFYAISSDQKSVLSYLSISLYLYFLNSKCLSIFPYIFLSLYLFISFCVYLSNNRIFNNLNLPLYLYTFWAYNSRAPQITEAPQEGVYDSQTPNSKSSLTPQPIDLEISD